MDQPIANPSQHGELVDKNALILSPSAANTLPNAPPGVELAAVRQTLQTLFARVEALQQNQAVQLAGVHMQARMSVAIDQAAQSAVEKATSTGTAALEHELTGIFSSLTAQIDTQRDELSQMRESKKLTETRVNRAVLDIERLCGNLAQRPEELPQPVESGWTLFYRLARFSPHHWRTCLHRFYRRIGSVSMPPGEQRTETRTLEAMETR